LARIISSNSPDGSQYQEESGTSFASPVVAGAAALVFSKYPDISPLDVIYCLMKASMENENYPDVLNIKATLECAVEEFANKGH